MSRARAGEPLGWMGTVLSFVLLSGICVWGTKTRAPAHVQTAPGSPAPPHARAPDARPVDGERQMSMVTLAPGKGPALRPGDRAEIRFRGHGLGEGTRSFVVGRGEVMPGWDEGVIGMQVGEKRRLVIPTGMQSDDLASTGVPITCEVELLAIGGRANLE
jgi:FKBP-type peptidyl-prolyl cis-trans isomerase